MTTFKKELSVQRQGLGEKQAKITGFVVPAALKECTRDLLALMCYENCDCVSVNFFENDRMVELLDLWGVGKVSRQWFAGAKLDKTCATADPKRRQLLLQERDKMVFIAQTKRLAHKQFYSEDGMEDEVFLESVTEADEARYMDLGAAGVAAAMEEGLE